MENKGKNSQEVADFLIHNKTYIPNFYVNTFTVCILLSTKNTTLNLLKRVHTIIIIL